MEDQTKQTGQSKQRYQRLFLIGWLSSMVPCDWIIPAHGLWYRESRIFKPWSEFHWENVRNLGFYYKENCSQLAQNTKVIMSDAEDELTTCPVCCEDYEENGKHVPRMLPCLHTTCEQCLEDLLKRRGKFVICAECRKQHHVSIGVKTFCQNKYILSHIRKENAWKIVQRNEKE